MYLLKMRICLIVGLLTIVVCDGEFECPSKADCTCSRGINGDYELLCPRALGHATLQINVQPMKYMTVQCMPQNNNDLSLLSGLQIGSVKAFVLRLCPLPTMPFKDLMSTAGIPNVKTLQVQSHSNLGNSLTRAHLAGLSEVTQLNFASNLLTEIPEDLFQDTTNLTWLDMKNNNLRLPKGIFRPVPKLEVLELGSNNLTYLEPGIFRNLTKLRLLNLWGNRLQNLSRSLFTDLNNLENLDLNNNGLTTLPPDLFADLSKLRNLNLNGNEFISLPQGLFLGTINLEKIQIHNNRRTLRAFPPALLSNLTHLREAYLNDCNLTNLPEDLLWGSVLLINLTLQKNILATLPPYLLKDNTDLQKINLGYNKITEIPEVFFSNQEKLTTLDLRHNQLTNISKNVFSSLRRLEYLFLQDNDIEYIAREAFQATTELKVLDLSRNKIAVLYAEYTDTDFGRHSILQSATKLETLLLSDNYISELYADWQVSMTSLQILDLSYNQISSLTIEDLQFLSTRLTMDLSYNNISVVTLDNAETLARHKFVSAPTNRQENESVRVILKGNPLECDCKAYYLVKFLRGELDPRVEYIVDFDVTNFTCSGPPEFAGRIVRAIDPRVLTCKLRERDCPKGCSCSFRRSNLALVVDCSFRNLTAVPLSMPASEIVLDVTNHTELDLTGNRITSLPNELGKGYGRVTELKIGHNNLTKINISVLSPNLEVLMLENNNLSVIDNGSLKMLENAKGLRLLTLHKNPWKCDCSSKDLLLFIHRKYKEIISFDNITCASGAYFSNITKTDLCPTPLGINIGIALSLLALLGFIICLILVLYYKYQREIKVWLYARGFCLWFVKEEELDKDKVYDAFVSYSHQDERFIVDELVPGLENGSPSYKLCLHYRDWIVGDFIPNQITRSVEDSRRTIVVLSPNFIESVWGRMEFRAAHMKALSEGRARLIVILYGELGNTDQLEPELKAYLSMNTYVKWGDPWFWEKLRYAMPHPPNQTKSIPLISQALKLNGTEKLVNSAVDVNSITTPPTNIIVDPLKNLSSKLS
ncbi:protein toll isoform X2 [Cimex lectularius]|uniref:TIR domain-containing protein n=1 Tax=Cimex lectularius TaxID=79782 RepID=A0A8I6S145_CIMLE|nr:protein toll isoform X2 [Cimex lectularius]